MNYGGIPPPNMMPQRGMRPDEGAAEMMMNPPPNMQPTIPQQYMGNYGNIYGHGQAPMNHQQNTGHAMMEAEYSEIQMVMMDGGNTFGASAVHFDTEQELLWAGNLGGHMTSYYSPALAKYTSMQVHMLEHVRQISTLGTNVLSLMRDTIKCNTKLGVNVFSISNERYKDLQCMLMCSPTSVLLAGHQSEMFKMDVNTQQHISQVDVGEPGAAIMKYSNSYLCTGDTSGKIHMRDPDSLRPLHTIDAHSGTLSDFDVHGNRLISCGFAISRGDLTVERFVKVYDFRMMRAVSPIQVPIDPMFLRFVPQYSERICVVSQTGQFQLIEQGTNTPSNMMMYNIQTEGAVITAFDVSSTYQAISFADSGGLIHLFANGGQEVQFNAYSQETEFPANEPLGPPIKITDDLASLNTIPMQYPTGGQTLLSDWPQQMCVREYRKPQKIDPNILMSVKTVRNVGYAPNPGTQRRNQMPYKLDNKSKRHPSVPDSPIGRGYPMTRDRQSSTEIPLEHKTTRTVTKHGVDDSFFSIPKRYRKTDIKYSKLGIEDFDFRHYNKTNFAGLESHIPNAYCNSMLQILYFIEPLRTAALSHLCEKEFCLTCELGFLCHMLDEQKGKTCQATNFLRAFRTIPEVTALGLLLSEADEIAGKMKLARLVQNLNRFMLQQINSEFVEASKYRLYRTLDVLEQELNELTEETEDKEKAEEENKVAPVDTAISRLFYTQLATKFRCRCKAEFEKTTPLTVHDLLYPDITPQTGKQIRQEYSFSDIASRSLCADQSIQTYCNSCEKFQNHVQTRVVKELPDILVFNCHLENERDINFWKTQEAIASERVKAAYKGPQGDVFRPNMNIKLCRYGDACKRKDCKFRHNNDAERGISQAEAAFNLDDHDDPGWVPLGLGITLLPDGTVKMQDIIDEEDPTPPGSVRYDLMAMITHIKDNKTGGNLTSCIKVSEPFHLRKEKVTCTQWYLFNDFSVTPIEKYEATYLHLDWKVPCVIYFNKRGINKTHDLTITNKITPDVLFREAVLVTPRKKNVTFVPLMDTELPKAETVVGLDTEFVTLNQEEAELRSDGTQNTIKPSQVSVARVSCIRGKGHLQGEAFIDDYISTQEQVVDYMTQFSGIKPGDLDASISSKHLTTLKSTYLKLRYLLDTRCLFVGHGLKKDFRVINLPWPKDQIIDTVDLFRLPRQRMISLKFLAWYFLGENIQSGVHDSTEDARTALKLYYKYQELCNDGGMDKMKSKLCEMYDEGRKLKWKVPESETDENEEDYGLFPTS